METILSSYTIYKKYHQNIMNRIIHVFCIPTISWSICVLLPYEITKNIIIFYGVYYLYLFLTDLNNISFVNYLYIVLYLFCLWKSSIFFTYYFSHKNIFALSLLIFSIIMLFIGYWVFEENNPIFIDNIYYFILMTPLYSFFELEDILYHRNII